MTFWTAPNINFQGADCDSVHAIRVARAARRLVAIHIGGKMYQEGMYQGQQALTYIRDLLQISHLLNQRIAEGATEQFPVFHARIHDMLADAIHSYMGR